MLMLLVVQSAFLHKSLQVSQKICIYKCITNAVILKLQLHNKIM